MKPLEVSSNFPAQYRFEKWLPWIMAGGIALGAAIALDGMVDEKTRCIADNSDWVDFNPEQCIEVIEDFLG